MATKKVQPTTTRRTFSDITKLSHETVKAELLALGIMPLELVSVPVEGPRPTLQEWQRWDYRAFDAARPDPFLTGTVDSPDLAALDRYALYGHELDRYIEELTLSEVRTRLETLRHDLQRDPARDWTGEQYRKELASRISHADHEEFKTKTTTPIPTNKPKGPTPNAKARTIRPKPVNTSR